MGNEVEFGGEEAVSSERSEGTNAGMPNRTGAGGAGVKVQPSSAKKQTGWKIATGVLVLLVIALGGLLTWRMLAKETPVECQDTATGDDEKTDDTAAALLAQDAQVREVVAEVKAKAAELLDPYNLLDSVYDVMVPYEPEGYLTAIQLNRGYGFKMEYSENPTLLEKIASVDWMDELGEVLEKRGFVDTGEYYTTASAVASVGTTFVNDESGVVCGLWNAPQMYCSYKDWYDKADAELANELSRVFEEATGEEVDYLVAEVDDIRNSSVAPYQTIEVRRRGYGSSFYRVSPEAEWVYSFSGQGVPTCDEYNTEDLRKAYAGQTCWTNEGDSVVQP